MKTRRSRSPSSLNSPLRIQTNEIVAGYSPLCTAACADGGSGLGYKLLIGFLFLDLEDAFNILEQGARRFRFAMAAEFVSKRVAVFACSS